MLRPEVDEVCEHMWAAAVDHRHKCRHPDGHPGRHVCACRSWQEGRTPAEVTAAAERTADITLRLVRVTRERDHARDIAVALEQENEVLRRLLES